MSYFDSGFSITGRFTAASPSCELAALQFSAEKKKLFFPQEHVLLFFEKQPGKMYFFVFFYVDLSEEM